MAETNKYILPLSLVFDFRWSPGKETHKHEKHSRDARNQWNTKNVL